MTFDTIQRLSIYKPRSSSATRFVLNTSDARKDLDKDTAGALMDYVECYKDLDFGWKFAKELAATDTPFPSFLEGDDLYVWRAYNYIKHGHDDVIKAAVAFTTPDLKSHSDMLRAFFVTADATHENISVAMGIDIEVVKAYEKLFFNILDRKQDRAFIASTLYPESRAVEMFEDYIENTGLGLLLMRAGYKFGPGFTAYCAGLAQHAMVTGSAEECYRTFESMNIFNGITCAMLGGLNQRSNAQGVYNARQMHQATKIGGADAGGKEQMPPVEDSFRHMLIELSKNDMSSADLTIAPE